LPGRWGNDHERRTRLCPQCGEALKLIVKLFDQNKGCTVRFYRCRSDHVIWNDELGTSLRNPS
jgi:hypothetical protein